MMFDKAKPYLYVIFLQFGNAGLTLIAKAALNHGMNHYTFSVYRNLLAAIIMAPFALLFERKRRPTMTISIFLKIMLLGLLEPVLDQNLYYTGMKYTTATFSIAMCNIIPAMTFVMAWMCRLEKVDIRKLHSQGKILGTIVTVGGAMIMTVVTGPAIGLPWAKDTATLHQQQSTDHINPQDHLKGSLMIIAACLSWACFFIVQAITLKSYPAEMSLTSLICASGALQGTVLTLIVERNKPAIWALNWNAELVAIVYGGVICSGMSYYLTAIVMKEKGPVFVTAFNPLSMVIVAVIGSFVLAEQMNLGRILGPVVIVIGLYLVIWGKSKDENTSKSELDLPGPDDKQQIPMTNSDTKMAKQEHYSLSITVPTTQETLKNPNGNSE